MPALTQAVQDNLPSHYKIIKLLNQGGMGEIYLAEDQRLHRTVAIKTLKPELAHESINNSSEHNKNSSSADTQAIETALHEARLLAKLNHANIVQIYDITQQDQQISLIMEYLDGKTLQSYQQEHIVTLTQKLAIISQISKGLTAAHNHGIVHCDLKPNNIIIDQHGGVKIVDFGIAKLTKTNTNATFTLENNSQSFGSQTAMSPEQLNNVLPNAKIKAIDFRSDLFSLGIIAFQLISGQHPFASDSASKTAQNILKAQCQQAQDIVPRLPHELITLLNQLLANQVEHRPQSSQWVTEQFEKITKYLSQQEILAEDTQPITSELSTELAAGLTNTNISDTTTTKRKGSSFIFSRFILFIPLLIALLVTAGIYRDELFTPAELPVRYIVVLPATVTHKNPNSLIADMQRDLVTATLDDAIRQSIINTKGLRLISRSEVTGVSKDAAEGTASIANIAAATGASDIITTQLDCNNVKCDITLSRLTANSNINNKGENSVETVTKRWTVLTQKKWPSQVESYYDIYRNSKANLASIFSNYNTTILTEQPIKQTDYVNYVTLYNQIRIAGYSNDANLHQLKKIISSSPYLYAAYSLYRESALNLYNDNNEIKYINQIKSIIASAPPEYKYSTFQAINEFYIAVSLQKYNDAKRQLAIAIERGIDNSSLIELQAFLYLNNNELLQAKQKYQTALNLRPSTKLLYNLALSYYWLNDFTSAKQTLKRLLNIAPTKYNAKQLLADIYLSAGELKPAILMYEDILKIDPQSIDIDNLGLAYALSGRNKDALRMAQLAVKNSPKHPTRILNLADIKLILGMTEQAASLYQQVIQLSHQQEDLEALLIIAQAYVHLGQHKMAIKALNQAKKLAPDSGEVAFIAALVYSQLGERISAVNQVEEALAAGFGIVWFNLPWFDPLCADVDFHQLVTKASKAERCQL